MCSGDIVTAAGGNYTSMAATGGVVAIHIKAKITLVSYLFSYRISLQGVRSIVILSRFYENCIAINITKKLLLKNVDFSVVINSIVYKEKIFDVVSSVDL